MKILIVSQYFYPENFKCNDMAFELQKRGHEVTVLTGIPNYPKGKYFDGYGIFKKRKEILYNVEVHRSFLIPRGKGGGVSLALNYLSYTLFASFKALTMGFKRKFDVIIVHEPSPILVGIPAIIIKRIQKIPLYFWVLDLWPESLTAAGGIANKTILRAFEKLTIWIYKNSTVLLIGSKGYRQSINKKGDFDNKIKYFPNWVEESLNNNTAPIKQILYPDGFNIVVAGNMGDAQDLPHVLDAMLLLKGKPINLIFIGDGRKKYFVEQFSAAHKMDNQIICLGRHPLEQMPSFFSKADILFMSLKDEPIFALTVPSRLQAYMSAGKPVVAMINGEGAELIKESDCGWSVPAEDSKSLAKLFDELSKMDKCILSTKGQNGKAYSDTHFKFSSCIDNLENYIK
ncbi:MAG: glycosyltransferase family 4 protein [Bacteroidales bacterium]|nr:glycosyltransferase family 4 protein [Bacteroidales bacterium]